MQKLNLRGLSLALPLGMFLSLCVACGGDDDGGNGNKAGSGSGGGDTTGNGGANAGGSGGSGNKAGSSSSGGNPTTGGVLSGDTSLGGLSDGDLAKLCDEIETFTTTGSYGMSLQEMSCLLTGMITAQFAGPETDAELQAGCKSAYDQCKAQPFEPETSECMKPEGTCTATVAELRQCMQDSAKAMETVVADLPTCSELTLDATEDPEITDPMDPPSCVALQAKCPGLEATTNPMGSP